ncbi:MAG: hypothetical protein JXL97_12055 [Bacteroidales bacterium]|nr:hypothetical protein [Bacteroidales bacterium]
MSNLNTLFFTILMLISFSVFSQNKTVEVYTTLPNAGFIPFINGEQMLMMPVDTFFIDADTLQNFELIISFEDTEIADIKKKINFDFLKHKKYEIVYRGGIAETIDDLDGSEVPIGTYQKYMIKDRSAKYYLKKTTTID